MDNYKYGIIDFELINRRNSCVLKRENLNVKELLNLNMLSIFKLIDTYGFDIPVLLFDSRPYFKSELLSEYKENRKVYTEEDLTGLEKDSSEYSKIELELLKNSVARNSKQYIIDNWKHFTIPLVFKGLEADDLSFMITRLVKDSSIHITKDSDYVYHVYPSHDVTILKKGGDVSYKYHDNLETFIPLEYQKALHELFVSSHNGVDVKKLKISINDIYSKHVNKELEEDISKRIEGLNPLTYLTAEVKDYIINNIARVPNPNIAYLKTYKYLSNSRIQGIKRRQSNDFIEEFDELFI